VASKRAHTRENPERPFKTPLSDPEKITRRGRYLQRQTSGAASTSRSGITRGTTSLSAPRKPSFKSTSIEASCSREIVRKSEILKDDEPSIDSTVIDLISEYISVHNLGKEVVQSTSEEDCSSSLISLQIEPKELYSYTYTIFPIVESVIQDLFVKGEENLTLLLGQIYKAFFFPDPYEFNKTPLGRIWLIEDEEAEFKI